MTGLAFKGLETVEDFAFAYPELSSIDDFLQSLSEADLDDLGAADPLHSVHAARLRKALRLAHQSHELRPLSLPATLLPQASPSSGMEHLPPKLSSVTVQDLVSTFKANYPGELLDDDTMPSIRLLSLVQHSLRQGKKLRWISWQLRLSAKQYTEIKSSKPMRTEAHLLASALYDDTAEMAVAHLRLSVSWLQRIQTVFRNNAWALCGAAHLNNRL